MQVEGKARLIRYTADPEQTIALAAKLCYASDEIDELIEKIGEKDNAKFIGILTKMNHYSPFEHASFTFAIEGVSRALLAQITRHRIASFSVRSQMYVSEGEFNYILPPAVKALGAEAEQKYAAQMAQMLSWYREWQQALGNEGEKSNEDARFVLPNACETKMIVTMNARELLHFFSLRCCNRAQWEIRNIAWQMLGEVLRVAPSVFAAAGPGCLTGACPEGKKSCGKAAEIKQKHAELLYAVQNG